MKKSTLLLSILLALTNNAFANDKQIPAQSQNDKDSTIQATMRKITIGTTESPISDGSPLISLDNAKKKDGVCPSSFPIGRKELFSLDDGATWKVLYNTCSIVSNELKETECPGGQSGNIIVKRQITTYEDKSRAVIADEWQLVSNTCGQTTQPQEPEGICEDIAPPHSKLDYVILPKKPNDYYGRICYIGPTERFAERYAERMSDEPIDQHISRNKLVPGQIGGQVESYSNLADLGFTGNNGEYNFTGWVAEQAIVGGSSLLRSNAQIFNNAIVMNSNVGPITGNSNKINNYIYNNAYINNALVGASSGVDNIIRVFGNTRIDTKSTDKIKIDGNTLVFGNTSIDIPAGAGQVSINNSKLSGNTSIKGKATIKDSTVINTAIGEPRDYTNYLTQNIQLTNTTINGNNVVLNGKNVKIEGSLLSGDVKVNGPDLGTTGGNSLAITNSVISDNSVIGNRLNVASQHNITNSKIAGDSLTEGYLLSFDNNDIYSSKIREVNPTANFFRSVSGSKITDSDLTNFNIANSVISNTTRVATGNYGQSITSKVIDGDTETTNPPPSTP